jgi:hypothetical protein
MKYLTPENAKVGMTVKYIFPKEYETAPCNEIAKILIIHSSAYITVEWITPYLCNQGSYGIDSIGDHRPIWEIIDSIEMPSQQRQEKECTHCNRMNDKNVFVCWWCGNKP